jgi:cysteine desulfurase
MTGMPRPTVYLDHAATTPLRPEARDAMLPWLGGTFGNPSGAHRVAREARKAIDEARDLVAEALGCEPNEVIFTSGGTEADNLAVLGRVRARPGPVLCSAVEHHAVLHPVEHVGGHTVPVAPTGHVDLEALAELLEQQPETTLVSVMAANNEVGVVQPLADVVRVVRRLAPQAAVHTDAVQAAAWLDVAELAGDTDMISVSGHKLGGPQGTGVLVVRRRTALRAVQLGGGQEREQRSGTHNVAGIVGLAAAFAAERAHRAEEVARVATLRDRMAQGLRERIEGLTETVSPAGDRTGVLPGTVHVAIPGAESDSLLFLLDEAGICASAASACASGAQQASHVLAAMGLDLPADTGVLRLTLGWTSTDGDVDRVLDVLPEAVVRLRRPTRAAAVTEGSS